MLQVHPQWRAQVWENIHTHMHTPTHPHTHTPTHAHKHTRAKKSHAHVRAFPLSQGIAAVEEVCDPATLGGGGEQQESQFNLVAGHRGIKWVSERVHQGNTASCGIGVLMKNGHGLA